MRSVTECGWKDAVKHCLPATVFEWQEAAPRFEVEQLQFTEADGTPSIIHQDKRWLHDILPHGDANGDGVKDWVDWHVNAEGQMIRPHENEIANCFRPLGSFYLKCLQADFNSDGLTDSFRRKDRVAPAIDTVEIRFTPLPGSTASPPWIDTGIPWIFNADPSQDDRPLAFADFNGDGWVDIAMAQGQHVRIYFHSTYPSPLPASPPSPFSVNDTQVVYSFPSATRTHSVEMHGDMDGNGSPDLVLSRYPVAGEKPGLPRPELIILTAPLSNGGMTTTLRAISGLLIPDLDTRGEGHFFHDLNGDGLPDLLGIDGLNANKLAYRLNDGTGFQSGWEDLGITIPTRLGRYFNAGYNEWLRYRFPIMSKIFAMDYDGDGTDELMVADEILASACHIIGEMDLNGNLQSSWRCDDDLYGEFRANPLHNQETQINGDIKDNSVRRYTAKRFVQKFDGDIDVSSFQSDIIASASQTAVIDATGDGLPDVVTAFGCRDPQYEPSYCQFNDAITSAVDPDAVIDPTYSQEGAWINRNRGAGQDERYAGYDLLKAATDGLGARHEWDYRPLSSDADNTANSEFYEATHATLASDPDYFHFASSMYVVTDHRTSNGIGGLNSTKYRYRDAIYNNKGRGFQGFRSVIVEQDVYSGTQNHKDLITRSDFELKWPTSGIMQRSCTWQASLDVVDDDPACAQSGQLSGVIASSVTDEIHNVSTAGRARFVAVKSQTHRTYDLATPHGLLTTKTLQRVFDTAGNITSDVRQHTDFWTDTKTTTTNVYEIDFSANWWLNKLSESSVTQASIAEARPNLLATVLEGLDDDKTVVTTISEYHTAHRLPKTTVRAGDDHQTTTTTTVNTYGLPMAVTISAPDVAARTVTTTYTKDGSTVSADGYLPFTITNALGHEEEIHYDMAYGKPVSQWDANELQSQFGHDAFGRPVQSTTPGTPTVEHRLFWCTAVLCPDADNARYKISSYQAGAPEQHVYLDLLDREVGTDVSNFAGTADIRLRRSFNARGLVAFESVPHDVTTHSSLGTRYTDYDALGRGLVKEMDQSDGSVLTATYTHTRFKTDIDAGGLLMHRIYNGLDQLVQTKDAMGGHTQYAYDAAGNPIVIADPGGHKIKSRYNSLGFKEFVDDPNMGLKSFSYNAVGEVLTETDANLNTLTYTYDDLGRMTSRSGNGNRTAYWHYDSTDTHKGLGLLDYEEVAASKQGCPTNLFCDDTTTLRKHYFYAPATAGHKRLIATRHEFAVPELALPPMDTHFFYDSGYGRQKGMQYPGGFVLEQQYGATGYPTKEIDHGTGTVIRHVTDRDARQQVKTASLAGDNLSYSATYRPETGQVSTIGVSAAADIVDLTYLYDGFGNLLWQTNAIPGQEETEGFVYDDLHRLTMNTRNSAPTIHYDYDATGNLTLKDDYAVVYHYNGPQPNAVMAVDLVGGGQHSFSFDANGNLTSGAGRSIDYDVFNKPVRISQGPFTTVFSYGADLARYRQASNKGGSKFYVDKHFEIDATATDIRYIHYIADVAVLTKVNDLDATAYDIRYTHRDRLGSPVAITDADGNVLETRAHDPFGKPRDGDFADRHPPTLNDGHVTDETTDRGFTDHEHLDTFQLIHINGRGYDYNLGRFLSVDPIIVDPGNSQAFNPYSYVMNNPLANTDPSGYATVALCQGTGSFTGCNGSGSFQSFPVVHLPDQSSSEKANDNGALPGNAGGDGESSGNTNPDEIGSQDGVACASQDCLAGSGSGGRFDGTYFFGGAGLDGEYIPDMAAALKEAGISDVHIPNRELWSAGTFVDAAVGTFVLHEQIELGSRLTELNEKFSGSGDGKGQFNLIGYSYGAQVVAHIATTRAAKGGTVDNLVLIGAPISADFVTSLEQNAGIRNVIVKDLNARRDPIYAGVSRREMLVFAPLLAYQMTQSEGHFYYAPGNADGALRRRELGRELYNEGLR